MKPAQNRTRPVLPGNGYRPAAIGFTAAVVVFAAISLAQSPPPASSDAPDLGEVIDRTTAKILVAPVLVKDASGNIVDGLQPAQFHLYDNGKEQNIQVDSAYEPISLVVAIEKSARVDAVLSQIHRLGSLLQQITGMQGETAVLAFDSRLQLAQDFTTDGDKVKVAINNIKAGSTGTRLIDAVERGVFMLRHRAGGNRKVILLVSETRDEGSQARLRETMIDATLSNILIYSVDISQVAVRATEERADYRPTTMDPAATSFPMGIASTPTTVEQNYGMGNRAQFIPLLKEIFIDAKGLFVRDPSTQFSRATGGAEFLFIREKGLEKAVQSISQEIHSQYLVSYSPNNGQEGGYHTIAVAIDRSPSYVCKTRPGYWIAGGSQ